MEIVVCMYILMLNIVIILFNFCWGFFFYMNGIVLILILKVIIYVIIEFYIGFLFYWKNYKYLLESGSMSCEWIWF